MYVRGTPLSQQRNTFLCSITASEISLRFDDSPTRDITVLFNFIYDARGAILEVKGSL